jgi:hypothetical protein
MNVSATARSIALEYGVLARAPRASAPFLRAAGARTYPGS